MVILVAGLSEDHDESTNGMHQYGPPDRACPSGKETEIEAHNPRSDYQAKYVAIWRYTARRVVPQGKPQTWPDHTQQYIFGKEFQVHASP